MVWCAAFIRMKSFATYISCVITDRLHGLVCCIHQNEIMLLTLTVLSLTDCMVYCALFIRMKSFVTYTNCVITDRLHGLVCCIHQNEIICYVH